jgi:hypothetical protein
MKQAIYREIIASQQKKAPPETIAYNAGMLHIINYIESRASRLREIDKYQIT